VLAIEHDHLAVAEALLEAGADVNRATAAGWTALHHAIDAEADGQNQTGEPADLAIIEVLLRAGADSRAVFRSPPGDQTPGQLARAYGWVEAAGLLGS
jgi:ankyrin repeat protein